MKGTDIWFSRRSIGLHVVIIIVVLTFAALCVWQVHRALDGNNLSWAYVFEWPFFAGYAVYMWWRFVHEVPEEDRRARAAVSDESESALGVVKNTKPNGLHSEIEVPEGSGTDAADMAAYNDYLADLAERGKPKHW
jgi:DNA-binding transcriptional regulator of glucitol operon